MEINQSSKRVYQSVINMKIDFKYFLLLIFNHVAIAVFAQKINAVPQVDITPMHKYLQKNADSTILFERMNYRINRPEYFIISKVGDTISIYQYQQLKEIDKRILLPKAIGYRLYKRNRLDYLNAPADVNIYFNPLYLNRDSSKIFWQSLLKQQPWQINDDSIDGEGCPNAKDGHDRNVYDGGGISLYLITKSTIKRLCFYAPRFYEEEVCPGRKGRKTIIEIEKLFKTYFSNEW